MKSFNKIILISLLFVFPFISFAWDRYTTGSGLVPDCNYTYVAETSEVVDGQTVVTPAHFSDECDFDALVDMINKVIDFILFILATPIFAIIVVYAGWLYLSDGGSSKNVSTAKKILKNAILGYVFALAGWLIVKTILVSFGFTDDDYMFLSIINNYIA